MNVGDASQKAKELCDCLHRGVPYDGSVVTVHADTCKGFVFWRKYLEETGAPGPSPLIEGRKFDHGKTRLDLLPFRAVQAIGIVLTKGAKKYDPNNWRKVKGWRWRYLGAALRHLIAYAMGERNDLETGDPHLAHAGCCIMFMLELELENAPDGDVQ